MKVFNVDMSRTASARQGDPDLFQESGFYGRELEEITKQGGLMEVYGYIYDSSKSSYIKQ